MITRQAMPVEWGETIRRLAIVYYTRIRGNREENIEQAIEAAINAGAEQYSPVELRFAREKLAEAHKGMEFKQYDKAVYLIEQSEINSELAIEKSRTAEIRERVAELARMPPAGDELAGAGVGDLRVTPRIALVRERSFGFGLAIIPEDWRQADAGSRVQAVLL